MTENFIKSVLEEVKAGKLDVDKALNSLRDLSYKDLGYAKIDNHRQIRTGYPEVIFGLGKSTDQIRGIIKYMLEKDVNILATRISADVFEKVKDLSDLLEYNELAQTITCRKHKVNKPETHIAIVTAGTGDLPVAEEAAVTADIFGNEVRKYFDVGVAGIHRLFDKVSEIRKARVVIVVAGMEGALPSIVGGQVDKPVIAVPTSVGYGANFGGVAALLGMLTSCASGISVVNIDNGFGAGYLAGMINNL